MPNKVDLFSLSPSDMVVASYKLLNKDDREDTYKKIECEHITDKLNARNFDDFALPDNNPEKSVACPNDSSHTVVKNGKDCNNRQRYKCKECGRTFSAAYHSLSTNASQNIYVWYRFISGMLKQESIRSLSKECGICRATAENWQLKVFEALLIVAQDVKLSDVVIADDTMYPFSFKGNHNLDFSPLRKSRKRGSQNTKKNFQKNQLSVLCAIDNNNRSFSKYISKGTPKSISICNGFKGKLENVNVLVTDGAKSFGKSVQVYDIPRWERKPSIVKGSKRFPDTSTQYHIQKVNSYHDRLKAFLAQYNGVSSRFLPGYLCLFDFLENNKDLDLNAKCSKILLAMSLPAKHITYEQIDLKYTVPLSNDGAREIWEVKISPREQKIYFDWYSKMPIQDIMNKYNVTRRKIYTVKEKVDKYGVQDKIIATKGRKRRAKTISEKALAIYNEYKTTTLTLKQVGEKHKYSEQYINKIVKEIDNYFPEYSINKITKQKKVKVVKDRKELLNKRNNEIYTMFKFLYVGNTKLYEIYKLLSETYELKEGSIENLIIKKRHEDPSASFRYHWSEERLNLSPTEYEAFLNQRNRNIYFEYLTAVSKKEMNLTAIKENLALKNNISFSHYQLIIREQAELLSKLLEQSLA